MYNFKMPSKLVQKGQPLPEMPEGIGMEMPSAPSMQPDQTQGIQSMMANYNPPAAPWVRPSSPFNLTRHACCYTRLHLHGDD